MTDAWTHDGPVSWVWFADRSKEGVPEHVVAAAETLADELCKLGRDIELATQAQISGAPHARSVAIPGGLGVMFILLDRFSPEFVITRVWTPEG